MTLIPKLPKIRGKYREKAELAKICWFRVGGQAEVLFIPEDLEDLQNFLINKPKEIPIHIIGVGSNLLIRDGGVEGVVIRLGRGFNYIKHNKDNIVTVGASVLDVNLALYTQTEGIAGLEFFSGIPGTIGGAIAMNAGAYGHDISAVLIEAKAININSGKIKTFSISEMGYVYRGNGLGPGWIFVEAKLQGHPGDKDEIAKNISEIQQKRSGTQPIKTRTSGSTFKNPPNGLKAWELIDKAGCRGLMIGGAQVSEMHCNFFINTGNATSQDLENLIQAVKSRVYKNSNIELKEEIKIIGNS